MPQLISDAQWFSRYSPGIEQEKWFGRRFFIRNVRTFCRDPDRSAAISGFSL